MHLAVKHEKKDLIGALVEIGVDVNAKDEQGRTALMRAAAKDWTVGVWTLLEKGARMDLRDQKGQTAYVYAFNHRSLGSLLLLKHFNKPRLITSYQLKRKAKVLSKIKKGSRQKG
jgi:ankyrin repeat protein